MSDPRDYGVSQDYRVLATDLAAMARELLAQESVQETLRSIVAHATKLVNGCEAASILVVRAGAVRTLAASEPAARLSDRAQGELDGGPCFDATVQGERVYRIPDMDAEQERWPRYVQWARELGVGSMMGFLLYTDGLDNLGALDMYSSRRGAFGVDAEHVGWVLASHAAVALSGARHVENLDAALVTSRVIGEAIGVVMARYKLTEHAAWEAVVRVSQSRNEKVRELAETITATGKLPDGR